MRGPSPGCVQYVYVCGVLPVALGLTGPGQFCLLPHVVLSRPALGTNHNPFAGCLPAALPLPLAAHGCGGNTHTCTTLDGLTATLQSRCCSLHVMLHHLPHTTPHTDVYRETVEHKHWWFRVVGTSQHPLHTLAVCRHALHSQRYFRAGLANHVQLVLRVSAA